jgi:hypothetical protein
MTTGRNDPCPCGSGRKYKHCCQPRDAEAARQADDRVVPFRGQMPRGVRDTVAAARTWEADTIPLMITIEEEDAARPVLVMVTAAGFVVHQNLLDGMSGGAHAVAAVIDRAVSAAARKMGAFPERLRVRHDDVAEALEPLLHARDVAVEAGETPELVAVARDLMQGVAGYDVWPPACHAADWDAWRLPRPLVADAFSAAADYYRRAPWRHASNLQAPFAVLPSGRTWTCGILGNGGEEFGLALYSDASDLFDVVAMNGPDELFDGILGRIISLTFESASEVGSAALRTARTRRLVLAGPAAYPVLATINTPGGGVSRDEVADLITLLRALPAFAETHRAALVREERTGDLPDPIAWTEPESGIVFHYTGESSEHVRRQMNEFLPLDSDDIAALEDMPFHPDTPPLDIPGELREVVAQVIEELGEDAGEDEMMEALNAAMQQRTGQYNANPQAELGDLSPVQVRRLMSSDWEDPDGAVQLRRDLPLDDVAHVAFLERARALLHFVIERGPLDATQAGYIRPAIVNDLIDHLGLTDRFATMRASSKRITEQDVWPLHIARVICELAGLLHCGSRRYDITPEGRRLADSARAGELYALLFRTWFREFNTDYVSDLQWPGLQEQVAFTLYRLPAAAADWRTATELLPTVVLPFTLTTAPTGVPEFPLAPVALASAVLHPLVDFGLLETRSPEPRRVGKSVYRATPLASKLIRFALD